MKNNIIIDKKMYLFFVFIFIVSLFFVKNITAKTFEWSVKIFNTENFEETQYIAFKVEDSDNVLKGKLAPGIRAISNIEIDLTDTNIPVDICVEIDDSNLSSSFKLTTTLDGKNYNLGTTEKIKIEKEKSFKHNKSNDKKILRLELEWIDNIENNEIDTILGANAGSLIIPVKITVKQHI